MQKVKLVGEIAKFGSSWETNCTNISDIFKLIDCQTPGFRQHIIEGADSGVAYEIKRGEDFLENPEELLLSLNNESVCSPILYLVSQYERNCNASTSIIFIQT